MSRAAISRVYKTEHSDLLSSYGRGSGRDGKIQGGGMMEEAMEQA
jgi:hypothetical protein